MEKHIRKENAMFPMSEVYCLCLVYHDEYKEFLSYKENKLDNIEETKKQQLDTLALLVKLGYSIEKIGTYFYRDMILKLIEYLENIEQIEGFKAWINYRLKNCERKDLGGYSTHMLYIAKKG